MHVCALFLPTLQGEAGIGIVRWCRGSTVLSSCTSALSMLSMLVVPVNHMPGGVSTASAIPLQGFLPLDGSMWSLDELTDVIFSFQGGRRVRGTLACATLTTFSPLSVGWSFRWRAAVGRRSYEGVVQCAMIVV